MLITIAFGATFGALSAIFSGQLSSIMSSDPAVIAYSQQKMVIISSTYFICGINEIMGGKTYCDNGCDADLHVCDPFRLGISDFPALSEPDFPVPDLADRMDTVHYHVAVFLLPDGQKTVCALRKCGDAELIAV